MNETMGNARTKQAKNPIFTKDFSEREPLKERENHSLKDSEKTTGYNDKVKTSTKTKEHDCSMCVFSTNLASHYGYPYYEYIPGCLKKILWFYIQQNPKKCKNFIQKGGLRL